MINGKIIIGLTGNIATGKSVVRRMLSNSGALGIDADLVAHRCLYPGGAAYQPVIQTFTDTILDENRLISHEKLGQIVFNDPEKLAQLESLTHPAVTRAIKARIHAARTPIVVIEAIKLLESDLVDMCDTIWVSHIPESVQLERLMQSRSMTRDEGLTRINAQPSQSKKLSRAKVVINTDETFFNVWQQVNFALNDTIRLKQAKRKRHLYKRNNVIATTINRLDPMAVESFWKHHGAPDFPYIYERLGLKMILPLLNVDRLCGMIQWESWNFSATLQRVYQREDRLFPERVILKAFERHASTQQAEIMLLGPDVDGKDYLSAAHRLGYRVQPIPILRYPAWLDAVERITDDKQAKIWVKTIARPFENERNEHQNSEKSV